MKFGKQLLLRTQPGLEGGYVDYKEVKHLIKACIDKGCTDDPPANAREQPWL